AARARAGDELRQQLTELVGEGEQIVPTVTAWRDGAKQAEQLALELAEVRATAEKARLEEMLDQAAAEGKLTPAMREQLTSAFTTDAGVNLEGLAAYLKA